MSEQPHISSSHDHDTQGWNDVAEKMHTWHPDLQQHARRNLAKRGLDHLMTDKNKLASYEGGWGFFDEHSLTPGEFQVTQDDDLLIDTLLGEQSRPAYEQEPLSPERRETAQIGVTKLFEAAWGFDKGTLSDIREARLRLAQLQEPAREAKKNELYQKGHYIRYQGGPLAGKRYDAFVHGSGSDFLHFGVPDVAADTPPGDKLDNLMRVYVHAKPEYAGHIVAEIVRRMRNNYGKEIYGKISDISTDDQPNALQREDNLLLYLKTHSEMAAAADIIKDLVAERPQVFNMDAGKLDRARQTDIPGVSIAEEPMQQPGHLQESFNSSRENVEADAQQLLVQKFNERYPQLSAHNFADMLQRAYKNGLKTKQELKQMYRQAVQYAAAKHGVSRRNYAMNQRS